MPYLNHSIPVTRAYVRNQFLFNFTKGHGEYTLCEIHNVSSIEGTTPLFECLMENGANWTRLPVHAFCWKKEAPEMPLEDLVYWDCFSDYIDVSVRNRLSNLRAELVSPDGKRKSGDYLFTLDWSHENRGLVPLGFSETHEHKCGHFFKMDDGNFCIYPNNRIIWYDRAFTRNRLDGNPGYQINMNLYSVEASKKYFELGDDFFYNPIDGSINVQGENLEQIKAFDTFAMERIESFHKYIKNDEKDEQINEEDIYRKEESENDAFLENYDSKDFKSFKDAISRLLEEES
jgi:hypothetical protein